jgi:hypothetical protein
MAWQADPTIPRRFFLSHLSTSTQLNPVTLKNIMASAVQAAVSSVQSVLRAPAHKVLLLGSGFVAKPCLDYLAKEGIAVTVGG